MAFGRHWRGVEILSPENFLKIKREEVRTLEERIIYLHGQKDQAAVQDNEQKKLSAELSGRCRLLETRLNDLEKKQFQGIDRMDLENQLVELSARYNEAAQDNSTSEVDAEILTLNQRLAQRRAEQYQSKYAQAMAGTSAKVQELARQYQRENKILKAFVPGISCPTCRRPVTDQNLSEVRNALQEVINAIVAEGRELRTQLEQLQQLDAKAQVVFDQFQADDIIKMQDELDGLTQQRAKLTEDRQTNDLRAQIQQLSASLEYGNLSQQEYEQLNGCRAELMQCRVQLRAAENTLSQKPEDFDAQIAQAQQKVNALKVLISNVVIYARKRAELTFEKLKMNRVEVSLYDVVKSTGEQKAAFKFTYNGRRYDRLSLSEKIRAGMELSELVKRLTGRNYPVFVDNMESVEELSNVRPTGQVIMAKCVHGARLSVQPIGTQAAVSKAA